MKLSQTKQEDILSNYMIWIEYGDSVFNGFNRLSVKNLDDLEITYVKTEDKKQGIIKVNARSRGPVINTVLENYGGGGHQFASGARLTDKGDVEKIIKDLNELCKEYK